MKIYKIKLLTQGSIMTPFQADTIFGHLCWAVAHREGDKSLKDFLEPFIRGNPPFVISDGFPDQLLPKPFSIDFIIDKPEEKKEWKRIELINFDDFNSIREGKKCSGFGVTDPLKIHSVPHNIVNRLTNTTLSEGGVYSLKEIIIPEISIYLKAVSDEWKTRVVQLLKEVSKSGFGRKKSIGKGQFLIEEVVDFDFPQITNPDGFVALSNFCPDQNDPVEGLYKTFIKYGKLGEEFTFCGNPFKRPLLMIKTGSVFKTGSRPKEFYGRIVMEGIAPAKPEVLHYAYAFAVPIKYPDV